MKLLENVLRLMQLLQLMQTQRIHPKNPLIKLKFDGNGILNLLHKCT